MYKQLAISDWGIGDLRYWICDLQLEIGVAIGDSDFGMNSPSGNSHSANRALQFTIQNPVSQILIPPIANR